MNWHYHPDERTSADNRGIFSVTHYMLYWKITAEERADIAQHRTTAYAASHYLQRVKPGDVLWIVNVHQHQLYLLGRLKVEFVVDDTAIAQELVDPQDEAWFEADWYAISNKYTIDPMREINITGIADQLRFNSRVSEMLDMVGGKVDAQQLLSLRELTGETAEMLDDIWYNDAYVPTSIQDYLELTEDDEAYAEGKVIVRTVKQRQRSRKLVEAAKANFRSLHEGRLYCEVCGFDFTDAYGLEYIEAHHTEPLANLEDEAENTIESVAMLCANCHRAAHSRKPPYTVDELKQMLADNEKENRG